MRYSIDPISADKRCLVNVIGLYLKTIRGKPVETARSIISRDSRISAVSGPIVGLESI
jgi:hypothetical protein